MAGKANMRIKVRTNTCPDLGYIKSVSYKNSTFKTTEKKEEAKRYSFNTFCNEMDFLAEFRVQGFYFDGDED